MATQRIWQFLGLLGLLVLSVLVVQAGLGAALAPLNPALALRIAPWNTTALSERATQLVSGELTPASLAEANALADRAVAREAVNASGVRTIGAVADARGNTNVARRLIAASEQLSRRDFVGQLWLIEDASRTGRVDRALAHYDVALRTSLNAPDMLFPVLSAASEDAELRTPIAAMIADKKTPWGAAFLLYTVSASRDPVITADLFRQIIRRGISISPFIVQALLGRLLADGHVDQAWMVYHASYPAAKADGVRDPTFKALMTDPTPFDWNFTVDGSASAVPSVIDGRTGLSFDAPVGTGGTVARQLLTLQPGKAYLLAASIRSVEARGALSPQWRLRCGDSKPLAQATLPSTETPTMVVSPPFAIPAGCKSQWLELVITATESPDGTHGVLDGVVVRPAGPDTPPRDRTS